MQSSQQPPPSPQTQWANTGYIPPEPTGFITLEPPKRRKVWPWSVGAVLVAVVGVGGVAVAALPDGDARPSTKPVVAKDVRIGAACAGEGTRSDTLGGDRVQCTAGRWVSLEPTTPPAAQTATVVGMFTVLDARCSAIESGNRWGYDDVPGSQVRVMDSNGGILGVTNLPAKGVEIDEGNCTYGFNLPDIETGHGFYTVEVGRRGETAYPESDLFDGLDLTLGH